MGFIITAIAAFCAYVLFIAGSYSEMEMIVGGIVAFFVAIFSYGFFNQDKNLKKNPLKIIVFLVYCIGPFFIELIRANIDVAYRVITGKIRPGIIKYKTGLKSDFGVMMIANSITLTPGTLTVDVDEETNDLYVHVLNISDEEAKKTEWTGKELFRYFNLSAWVRRITE